jgi:hypothetical protein
VVVISCTKRSAPSTAASSGRRTLGAEHGGELGAEDLDGDLPVVLAILGQIDRRHATAPQLPLDAVAVGQGGLEAVELVGVVGHGGLLRAVNLCKLGCFRRDG